MDEKKMSGMKLDIEAAVVRLPEVQAFVEKQLEDAGCPMNLMMKIIVAVEEIFTNIARYSYGPEGGRAVILVEAEDNPLAVVFTFTDWGVPYDPLAKEDPDISLPARKRKIGGLGIFMTKQIMDDIVYEYKDGQNILTLKKNL